ncbi:NADH dehydrogenase I subunit G [Candidatus Magnetoovum chiemensis]|nr:NADH dehydrogenase I subunit G [Candidatus Magnetoovum chiemensis]
MVENKIKINIDKCISCGKCVRVCSDIRRVGALRHPHLCPDVDHITFLRDCEMCGQCAAICPTGAILEVYKSKADKRVQTVCPYCATGCSIYLDVKDNKVVFVATDDLDPVGRGNLCVKGRFGFTFTYSSERITAPLIKKNGLFEQTTWDEALDLVSSKFLEIKDKHGPHTIGGIGSARGTNEDNYLFQRMMRGGLGTNNVDNCARL